MPTQSEPVLRGEWPARPDTPKRSVFGNYRSAGTVTDPARPGEDLHRAGLETGALVQSAIDLAVGRSFIHRFLAKAYEDPTPESWRWLTDAGTTAAVRSVAGILGGSPGRSGEALMASLTPDAYGPFLNASLAAFGHAARGSCPLNEIEYGDIKADPLFQPHRLADLAAFYRAFGLEVASDADERQDHICLELEFMCVLAAKEAYALEHQFEVEDLSMCRNAQKQFLREHLGRWTPAF